MEKNTRKQKKNRTHNNISDKDKQTKLSIDD